MLQDQAKLSFRISWVVAEQVYLGQCLEFPDLQATAATPEAALSKALAVVRSAMLNFQNSADTYLSHLPTNRLPTHPGQILRYEFLEPLELSPQGLSELIQIPVAQIDALIHERAPLTANIAVRLGKLFGISVQTWLGWQQSRDVCLALRTDAKILAHIECYAMDAEKDESEGFHSVYLSLKTGPRTKVIKGYNKLGLWRQKNDNKTKKAKCSVQI